LDFPAQTRGKCGDNGGLGRRYLKPPARPGFLSKVDRLDSWRVETIPKSQVYCRIRAIRKYYSTTPTQSWEANKVSAHKVKEKYCRQSML
jgi:hypothetical protein